MTWVRLLIYYFRLVPLPKYHMSNGYYKSVNQQID